MARNKKQEMSEGKVSKSTYKIIKTEFAYNRKFRSQEELDFELFNVC